MKGIWLLLVVILIACLVLFFSNDIDGFTDVNILQSDYISRQAKQFSNIGLSLVSAKNQGALGSSGNPYLKTFGEKENYPLVSEKDGLWAIVEKCESIKTMDCNAFDNPEFSKNCGMCLDIGENSEKVPATGGLILLAEDKQTAKQHRHSDFLPEYKPTIGFCPAGKMVSTKAECLKLQRQLLCQKNSSYDLPGCSQCYSSTSYNIIDPQETPGIITGHGTISIIGLGKLRVTQDGRVGGNINLSSTPYIINIRGNEGSRIKLSVSPPDDSDPEADNPIVPYLSGYLSGPTLGGEFATDLRRIILNDEVTGRKPRSTGKDTINGTISMRMSPGFGQTNMTLVVIVPFSFVETTMEESTMCKDAPFVTKQSSAEFLESDPCYKKGSGPGKYNMECLQGIWTTNGCTESGKGYPGDTKAGAILMTNSDGSFRTINEISDLIYNQALITSMGIDENGKKQTIKEWSAASVFCTGREVTSPCDTVNKNSGPMSPECIVYLWNNQGSKKLWNGKDDPIGPTYSAGNAVSAFSSNTASRSCQTTGTLSPIDANGTLQKTNVKYWQKQGGVNTIKRMMATIHQYANAQVFNDDWVAPYFKQCYGDIEFAPRPATTFSIQNNKLPETYTITRNTVLVNSLAMTKDYKLQFVITPRAIEGNWANIIHFTSTDSDWGQTGCRTPAIWFWPGNLKLHVRIGGYGDFNYGIDIDGCQLNKESSFSLECRGSSVTIILDGKTTNATQPTGRFTGNVKVYGSNPWYVSANASIKNVGLQLFEGTKVEEPAINGKIVWLDANDTSSFVLSGSTITTWKDKSGNGNNATGVNGPTLNSGKVVLNGNRQYFTTNYTAKAPQESVFIVYSSNNTSQSSLVESSKPGGRQFQNDGHQGIGLGPGVASMGVRWIAMGTMRPQTSAISLGELLYHGGGTSVYFNGNHSKSAGGAPGFTDGLTVIGGSPGQNGYYLNGTICEVMIYDRILTEGERQAVEGYLAWKWEFNTQLPRNHPFYAKAPGAR